MKVRQPDPDYAGIARVCRQQVRLATRGMDPDGRIADYLDAVPVKLSRRRLAGGTGRAGCFSYDSREGLDMGHIVINVWICCTEERFAATLYHELAHAVNRWVNGPDADSHGPLWKSIMVQLGQKPERCHNYRRDK